jgi:hypothetical protein
MKPRESKDSSTPTVHNVFVSSTFRDLRTYRQAVRTTIRRLGAVDIAMENMGSTEERPKKECERLIREEATAFVGIYARRWGYTPPRDAASITAYEYAVAGKCGLNRLIYLLDGKTRWPTEKCDRGKAQKHLEGFKAQLQQRHVVSFFSRKDQLAAMIAADLGKYFARQATRDEGLHALSPMSLDREQRLMKELATGDGQGAARAIAALARSNRPWVVETLHRVVLGDDLELARAALDTLAQQRGTQAERALAAGLTSRDARVRNWAAFRIGERALQHHRWGLAFVPDLIAAADVMRDDLRTICQVAHSLGKIGGEPARDALIALLRRPGNPPKLAATILHAPVRFWTDGMFASSTSYGLVDDFITVAEAEIRQWRHDFCKAVKDDDLYQYMSARLRETIDRQARSSE